MRCVNISVGIRSVLIISSWTAGPPRSLSVSLSVNVEELTDHALLAYPVVSIGLYRENAIAVRVIDRSAYDATSRASSAKKHVVSTQRLLHLLPASHRFCALIS